MRQDYKVTPRDRLELKRVAEKLRAIVGEGKGSGFNIVDFVRRLARDEILKTGKLIIEFFTVSEQQTPAYVTYNPTTLHVDFGTWQDADLGEPTARFIIAHELGHIALHDSYA
jgi:hypothetical protein